MKLGPHCSSVVRLLPDSWLGNTEPFPIPPQSHSVFILFAPMPSLPPSPSPPHPDSLVPLLPQPFHVTVALLHGSTVALGLIPHSAAQCLQLLFPLPHHLLPLLLLLRQLPLCLPRPAQLLGMG